MAGSTISGAQTGSSLVPVGSGTYRLVIINSGGQGQTVGSTGASTQLGYRLAAYSAASGGTGVCLHQPPNGMTQCACILTRVCCAVCSSGAQRSVAQTGAAVSDCLSSCLSCYKFMQAHLLQSQL